MQRNERGYRAPFGERHILRDVLPLKAPYIINIATGSKCNFNCAFCPANKKDLRPEFQAVADKWPKFTPMDLFEKIVDDLGKFEEKVKVVYFCSIEEPLLNKNVAAMVKLLKDKQVCDEVRIITNGSLLNPKLNQDLIDAGLDMLWISVEGLDSDTYSKLCKVKIDYDKFLENIRDYHIRCTGTTCKVTAKIFSDSFKNEADFTKFYDIFEPITHYQELRTIDQAWPGFDSPDILENHIQMESIEVHRSGVCAKAFTELIILSNGIVGLCRLDCFEQCALGNVYDNSLVDIWNSKRRNDYLLKHLQNKIDEIPYCSMCDKINPSMSLSLDDAKVVLDRINGILSAR